MDGPAQQATLPSLEGVGSTSTDTDDDSRTTNEGRVMDADADADGARHGETHLTPAAKACCSRTVGRTPTVYRA